MFTLLLPPAHTLKITLLGTDPPVWRRVVVRSDLSLHDLHYVIQFAMGWYNCHMHQFKVGTVYYGAPDPERGETMQDESVFTLADIAPRKGSRFRYEYDFGDSWMHDIRVEKIESDNAQHTHPVCLDGARNCPPEDVGGIWGYNDLLEAMADPAHERREELIKWLGQPFNPDALDLKMANQKLKQLTYH